MDRATARVRLAARGLVYVLMGILAVQMAFVDRAAQANQQGADPGPERLRQGGLVAGHLGFVGHGLWQPPKPLGHRMSAMNVNAPPD